MYIRMRISACSVISIAIDAMCRELANFYSIATISNIYIALHGTYYCSMQKAFNYIIDIITMLLAIKLATYVVTFLFGDNKEDINIFLLSKSATASY